MNRNRTKYSSLDRISRDPRVMEVWSEEITDDGLWISLVPGWNLDGASCVHEWNVKALMASFRRVRKGDAY